MLPLERARNFLGWTKAKAARECRVDAGNYHRIEVGQASCTLETANRIAKAFGPLVTRDQILFPLDYPQLSPDQLATPPTATAARIEAHFGNAVGVTEIIYPERFPEQPEAPPTPTAPSSSTSSRVDKSL